MFRIFPGRKMAIKMVFTHLLLFPSVLPTSLVLFNLVLSTVAGLLGNKYKHHSLYCNCALKCRSVPILFLPWPYPLCYSLCPYRNSKLCEVKNCTLLVCLCLHIIDMMSLAYTSYRYLLLNKKSGCEPEF